jgi:hypothetical protein
MRTNRNRLKRLIAAALALLTVLVAPAFAGVAAGAAPEGLKTDYSVSGDRMIWFQVDGNGVKQIHYRNLTTGEERKLTNTPSAKDAPYLYGNTVVWADKGAHAPDSVYWDIYSHNLDTGVTEKLNKRTGEMSNPVTDGVGVVWFDRKPYGDMYYRHLATGEEYNLGEGMFPVLADGKVVYRNARDGGLGMLDLRTGNRWPLVRLGGANAVDWFVFNGSHVLWKQKNGAGESQYTMLAVNQPSAQPVGLTPMAARSREYAVMALGDTQAVFVVDEGGAPAVKGVELASGRVYEVNAPDGIGGIVGFSGDRLVLSAADGSVSYVELTGPRNGGGQPGGGAPGGSFGGSAGQPGGDATGDRALIGPAGGELVSEDGQARLRFAEGTFTEEVEVGLWKTDLASLALADERGRKLQGYEAWRISADAAFGRSAELALGYGKRAEWLAAREKLGIYVYDEERGHWTYVGGVTGVEEGYVRAAIGRPGVYAVMLREVKFPDAQDHWARHAIEALAARGIVDGTDKGTFDPAGPLTRAQFAKLLAAALGLDTDVSGPAPFADVPAGAWYAGAVRAAAEAGLVEGDRGLFHPNGVVTREQMTVMLVRAVELGAGAEADAADLSAYRDAETVSGWARTAMAKAVGMKLIEGYEGALSPQAATTRAQAAVVIYRLLGQLNQL